MADYVVVGAGSAGCVLANRLTEDGNASVLLLEAGGRGRHRNIRIPAAFSKQFRTKLDWAYDTEPEPHCAGRSLYMPRGRGLGGSSAMNAMLYVRGRPSDYDAWAEAGATGWSWADVRPYFLKAEHNERGASEHHAIGGPLNVADQRSPNPLTGRFLAAAEAAGIPRTDDCNGDRQDGACLAQVTQRGGRRFSAADAYLRPALRRPNLRVVTSAQVVGIELDRGRATGVRYLAGGREHAARAEREVIVSAGALASPHLLMLSGIGPAGHLREIGIDVAVDLPGVGENLQDHPVVACLWDVPGGGSLADAERLRHLVTWLLRGTGPLTSTVAEAFAFVRTRPELAEPDLQYHFAPGYFNNHGFDTYDGHAVAIGPVLITPRSRGHVRLRSADPGDPPRITTNTLAAAEDVAALVAGVRLAREIAAAPALRDVVGRELAPGDADLEDDVRRRVELLYHPCGTCAIGPVVDPELRVHGVDGLRVADASVFPVVPGGNTNAPTIMVAERAADVIR